MFVKKSFTLLLAAAAVLAPSASAGNFRGTDSEHEVINGVDMESQRRFLQKDKNKNKNKNKNKEPVPTIPPAPTPPPVPPTPPISEQLSSRCDDGSLFDCIYITNGGTLFQYRTCSQCLANNLLLANPTVNGAVSCSKTQVCGGGMCNNDVEKVFQCGLSPVAAPTMAPETPDPRVVPVTRAPVSDTSIVPATIAPVPATIAPVPVATVAPIPIATIAPIPVPTTAPVLPPVDTTALCPIDEPNSGDSCSTGSLPFIYCCYDVQVRSQAGEEKICSCINGENLFMCYEGSPHVCSALITPGVGPSTDAPVPLPTDAPVPLPTDAPVPLPTDAPVPLPTDAPVPLPTDAPVPVPTDAPVPVPTDAPVPVPTDAPVPLPTDAPVPLPTDAPESDASLAPVPTSAPVTGPGGTSPFFDFANICPRNAPNNGESCAGVLPQGIDSATCSFQQPATANGVTTMYQKACLCRGVNWICVGGIPTPMPTAAPVVVPDVIAEADGIPIFGGR